MELLTLAVLDKLQSKIKSIEKMAGPRGDTGPEGKQGPKGEKGDKGVAGPRGKDGAEGKRGPEGDKGGDGKDGKDGESGRGIKDAYVDVDSQLVLVMTDDSEISVEIDNFNQGESETKIIYSRSAQTAVEGSTTLRWIEYATGFNTEPTLLETIPAGEVWQYDYSFGTLYRLIGTSEDSFYENYSSPNLSGLLATKQI